MSVKLYQARHVGTPYKTYKKVILGKVGVVVLDPFNGQPTTVILQGNPDLDDEECYISTWDEAENNFFLRMNKSLLTEGLLVEWDENKDFTEADLWGDVRLSDILAKPFIGFNHAVAGIDSPAVLVRLLNLARAKGKSESFIKVILSRLKDLGYDEEAVTYNPPQPEVEEVTGDG